MKVAVTGANGFVGVALTRQLSERGHEVLALVRSEVVIPGARVRAVDNLERCAGLDRVLTGMDVVIHLAGRAHVMRGSERKAAAGYRAANVSATRRVASASVAAGVRRFVFTSSIKVNGEQTGQRPFRADDEPFPADHYARSKLEAEQELHDIARASGLEVCIVRPPLVYGPGVKGNFKRFMWLLAKGVPLPLGSINNRRSFVGLTNLCDLLVQCAASPAAAGKTFLVSDGEDLSTPELIRRLARALGYPNRLFGVSPSFLQRAMAMVGLGKECEKLCSCLQVDIEPTRHQLLWQPVRSVDEELQETALWFLGRNRSSGLEQRIPEARD